VKILYGICGEGFGHASRSRILIRYLQSKGHQVYIVAGGKAYDFLSKEFSTISKIESAHFVYKLKEAKLVRTALMTVYQTMTGAPRSLIAVHKIINRYHPDIVITDADPISLFTSRFHRIPCISIDNPHALLYKKYTVKQGEFFSWFLLILALKITMNGAKKCLVYDFSDEPSNHENVRFFKPLIQDGILKQKTSRGNHIFVYHTIGSYPKILEIFKKMDETFIIYGANKDTVEKKLVFKPFNEDMFYQDISCAKAIITSGGFTVISEALFLKKPVFCLPIKNQFEQMLNGQFVEQLGVGESVYEVTNENISLFLRNLNKYQKNLENYNPGNQQETLHKIEQELLKCVK
jgi:uncharacterized protein (TIGR00661 family)